MPLIITCQLVHLQRHPLDTPLHCMQQLLPYSKTLARGPGNIKTCFCIAAACCAELWQREEPGKVCQ
jgi:hypothetical protein